MVEVFDLSRFDEYREDNRREVKKQVKGCRFLSGIPILLSQTVLEGGYYPWCQRKKGGNWTTTALRNASKLCKDFWDTINNPKKVSINLLSEDDVQIYEMGDKKDVIMIIYVPMAKREHKPVYINNDIFNGTLIIGRN